MAKKTETSSKGTSLKKDSSQETPSKETSVKKASKNAASKKDSSKKASKKNQSQKKPNIFKRMGKSISRYFRDIISEIKKIVWPTVKSTFKNTGVVLIVMVLVGIVIFGLDTGLHALFGLVMDLAGN